MSMKTDLVTNQKSKDYNQKQPFDGEISLNTNGIALF